MRLLLSIFVVFVSMVGSVYAAPHLEVAQDTIDWGHIYAGEQKDGVFTLHNGGDSALIINRVRSSCGCTAAMMSEETVQPGADAQLRVHFNSKHFSGQVVKRVMVISNDPAHPQQQFTLRAHIVTELVVTPNHLSLGAIQIGEKLVRSLTLENRSDVTVQLKALRSTSAAIRLDAVPKELQPGEKVAVQLKVTGPDKAGTTINGYLLIDAQGHTRTQMRLPIVARVAKQKK
jgi:hypothetical protein